MRKKNTNAKGWENDKYKTLHSAPLSRRGEEKNSRLIKL